MLAIKRVTPDRALLAIDSSDTLRQIVSSSIDFSGDFARRRVDWDSSWNGMHEDLSPTLIINVVKGCDKGFKVKVTSARHLQ